MPACGTSSRRCWRPRSNRATSSPRLRSMSSRGRSPARGGVCSLAIGSAPTRSSGGWARAGWARCGGRATSGSGATWRSSCCCRILSNAAERVRAFQHEARAAGTLNHINVLTVYDVGDHGGAPYLVTECLEGESLRARLSAGALSVDAAARHRAPGCPRAWCRARARHRASRPEAGEHLPGAGRPREDPRFRPRHTARPAPQAQLPEALSARHLQLARRRHRRIHGAGADSRRGLSINARTSSRSAPCSTKCSPAPAVQGTARSDPGRVLTLPPPISRRESRVSRRCRTIVRRCLANPR